MHKYDAQKAPMHKTTLEHQPKVQPSILKKYTEAIQLRQSTRFNLGHRFPTYAQEYASVAIVLGESMTMDMIISRRTKIYAIATVSVPDTMYFHQAMKMN